MDVTIIGAGASGAAVLLQLARALEGLISKGAVDPGRVCVRVVERQDVFGPGFPHSERTALPFHLINMCARDMGIVDGRPEDFQDWLDEHRNALARHFPDYRPYLERAAIQGDACTYVPRAVMGEYLKSRFDEAVGMLVLAGAEVDLLAGWEAEDLREGEGGLRLLLRRPGTPETRNLKTDRVVLATGHWFEETPDGRLFPSPWPPRRLQASIPQGARVGVIGTSLSALDAALTLTADGAFVRRDDGRLVYEPDEHPRSITLYSRSGLLPRVRGRVGSYRNVHLTRANLHRRRLAGGGTLRLRDLYELLDADLGRHYGRKVDWKAWVHPAGTPEEVLERHLREAQQGDGPGGELRWQTVLHQSFSMAREIYLHLAPEERKRFDRAFNTPFFLFASPMPPVNAEKLLALVRAGMVRVVRLGRDYVFGRDQEEAPFVFAYTDEAGERRQEQCDFVVDARGQKRSFETNPSPLARNLLAAGTVQIEALTLPGEEGAPYRTGGIRIDPETQRVVQGEPEGGGRVCERIYAVGVPTRGQILDASMAYSCARAAALVVRHVLSSWDLPEETS